MSTGGRPLGKGFRMAVPMLWDEGMRGSIVPHSMQVLALDERQRAPEPELVRHGRR